MSEGAPVSALHSVSCRSVVTLGPTLLGPVSAPVSALHSSVSCRNVVTLGPTLLGPVGAPVSALHSSVSCRSVVTLGPTLLGPVDRRDRALLWWWLAGKDQRTQRESCHNSTLSVASSLWTDLILNLALFYRPVHWKSACHMILMLWSICSRSGRE
jgi:hypothetical protein